MRTWDFIGMDEFGVLTERYGLKPQGKSTPMSASKLNVSSSSSSASNPSWGFPSNPSHAPSIEDSFVFARSSGGGSRTSGYGSNGQSSVNLDDFGDIFGGGMYNSSAKLSSSGWKDGGVDYDGLFGSGSARGSGSGAHVGQDDIFGGISGLTSLSSHKSSAAAVDDDDIFGGFKNKPSDRQNDIFDSFVPPPPRQSSHVHDLLDGFGSGNGSGFSSSNNVGSSKISGNNVGLVEDDLIPGFGGSNNTSTGSREKRQPEKFDSEDPFVILESTSKPVHISVDSLEEFDQFTEFKSAKHDVPNAYSPKVSSIDELEEFAKGKPQKHAGGPEILFGGKKAMSGTKAMGNKQGAGAMSSNKEKAGDDLESFSMKSRASSAPKLRPKNVMNSQDIPKMPQKPARGITTSIKKASSATNMFGDLSEMFGSNEYTTGSLGDFEEVEGETEERRIARMRRYERTQERVGKAVAEMNQRDYQTQQEQHERHRIAEKIDLEIKQWVAGKEGNMRALLSSLQNVLWRECGWEAVSLTDLITSSSVKKVHWKAALCVHPDKVQQKGATIEQKYTAEKVFNILQEAWKKFEADELR